MHELFKAPEYTLCYCPSDRMRADIHTKPVTNSKKWKGLVEHVGLTHRDSLAKGGIVFEADTPTPTQIIEEAKIESEMAPPKQEYEDDDDEDSTYDVLDKEWASTEQ